MEITVQDSLTERKPASLGKQKPLGPHLPRGFRRLGQDEVIYSLTHKNNAVWLYSALLKNNNIKSNQKGR